MTPYSAEAPMDTPDSSEHEGGLSLWALLWSRHRNLSLTVLALLCILFGKLGAQVLWPDDRLGDEARAIAHVALADSVERARLWRALDAAHSGQDGLQDEIRAVAVLVIGQTKYTCRNDYHTAVLFLPCDSIGIHESRLRSRP